MLQGLPEICGTELLDMDFGCQVQHDMDKGVEFLQRFRLLYSSESNISAQMRTQDQSLKELCTEMLRKIHNCLEICYNEIIRTRVVEWCIHNEISVFMDKLQKSETFLSDLCLALIGKKASRKDNKN